MLSIGVGPSHWVYAGSYDTLYSSPDGGNTWTPTPLVASVYSIATNTLGHVFASASGVFNGTGGGIFRSTNHGQTWQQINDGLTSPEVVCLKVDHLGYVVGGSYGGGVFRSLYPTTSVEGKESPLPVSASLAQNYPNPFNPATTITYELSALSHVTLKLYNLLGQEVATLVNRVEPPGIKSVRFDASGIPSGVYFYRLEAGTLMETRKMVILR